MLNRAQTSIAPCLVLVALLFLRPPAVAQFIQIEGGGSTLFDAQGGALTIQSENSRTVLGAGLIGGEFAYGARATFRWEDYDFMVGDNPIAVNLPTDIFNNVHYFVSRGVGIGAMKGGWHISIFDFATLIWPTCARLIWPTFTH